MPAPILQKSPSSTTYSVPNEAQAQQSLGADHTAGEAQEDIVGPRLPRLMDKVSPKILPQTSSVAEADATRRLQRDVATIESSISVSIRNLCRPAPLDQQHLTH
jgi:hypothetical protein